MSFCPLPAEMMTAFELHQEIKTFSSIFTQPKTNFQVHLVHVLVCTICFNSVLKPGCVKIERVGQVLEFLKIISMCSHSTWTIEIFEIYETIMWGVQSPVWNLCEGIQLWDIKQLWQSSECMKNLWQSHGVKSFVQAFNLDAPQQLEEKGIEAAVLFGNIGEIIEISDRFLEIGFHWGSPGFYWGYLVWQHRRDHWDQWQVP